MTATGTRRSRTADNLHLGSGGPPIPLAATLPPPPRPTSYRNSGTPERATMARWSYDAHCPACDNARSVVISTKTSGCGVGKVRRRACTVCGHRWWTIQPQELVLPDYALEWHGEHPHLDATTGAQLDALFEPLLAWQQERTGQRPRRLQPRTWR